MEGRTGTPLLWHKLSRTLQLNPRQGETRHNPPHTHHTPPQISLSAGLSCLHGAIKERIKRELQLRGRGALALCIPEK